MIIKIKNLKMRAIIGFNDWEREKKQEICINLSMTTDDETAAVSDSPDDCINYKQIKNKVIEGIENTEYYLLEKMASSILEIVMREERLKSATVEIDKPQALRFAESVSITMTRNR